MSKAYAARLQCDQQEARAQRTVCAAMVTKHGHQYVTATPPLVYELMGIAESIIDPEDVIAEALALKLLHTYLPGAELQYYYLKVTRTATASVTFYKHAFVRYNDKHYNPIACHSTRCELFTEEQVKSSQQCNTGHVGVVTTAIVPARYRNNSSIVARSLMSVSQDLRRDADFHQEFSQQLKATLDSLQVIDWLRTAGMQIGHFIANIVTTVTAVTEIPDPGMFLDAALALQDCYVSE